MPTRTFREMHGWGHPPGARARDGGADVAQQYLAAGLVDEMELHVVPLLLGAGARLFGHTDGRQRELECVRVLASPRVTHYRYRRRR